MRLLDILSKDCIKADLKGKSRREVIQEMVDLLVKAGRVKDKPKVMEAVMEREKLMSTGIGNGVAIPHAKTNACDRLCAAFGRSAGVPFDALDEKPVRLIFLLITPEAETGPHISALARISRLLKHKVFKDALLGAKDDSEIYRIIEEEERRR
ncbi:PTS sugar transporter subunit IIA [bacterium]|nr:PTS sugar transporter subunit IIA [bacterium]